MWLIGVNGLSFSIKGQLLGQSTSNMKRIWYPYISWFSQPDYSGLTGWIRIYEIEMHSGYLENQHTGDIEARLVSKHNIMYKLYDKAYTLKNDVLKNTPSCVN